jgi:hypothetical protein
MSILQPQYPLLQQLWKIKKNDSCKSVNTYLCKYWHGVYLELLLSFYANSSCFVSNHLSISFLVGFHGLNIPFYHCIFFIVLLINPFQDVLLSSSQKQNHLLDVWADLGSTLVLQQNPRNHRPLW